MILPSHTRWAIRGCSIVSLAAALVLVCPSGVHAIDQAGLERILDQRLRGDRTDACFAAAVIDNNTVTRAWHCADPAQIERISPDRAFEIGSVSKTMTAALLADLIEQGRASLDDPLAGYLPEHTAVPDYKGQPILLRHMVTHTSGLPALPSRMAMPDPADPYAALNAEALLASLADVRLSEAPGTSFAYSNFASMLLSWAVARHAGRDFESLLDERLFTPLGMEGAYVNARPEGVREAQGHLPSGQATPPWRFASNLAGVGGVRATLNDMVRYASAQLGHTHTPIASALTLTQQPVQAGMGMNWIRRQIDGRTLHLHEGGTGGFSALVGFDRERGQAVIVLSDTALHSLGGLSQLGLYLLGASTSPGLPRKMAQAPNPLLDGLVGDYRVEGGGRLTLSRQDGTLVVQPEGQTAFEMKYDDAGDFFPQQFDALLKPRKSADGRYSFLWVQGGGALPATRIDSDALQAKMPTAEILREYAGTYPLISGLDLAVRERDGRLYAQATGQGEFALSPGDNDRFAAPAFGIAIRFQRNALGAVSGLELHQVGHVLRGEKR